MLDPGSAYPPLKIQSDELRFVASSIQHPASCGDYRIRKIPNPKSRIHQVGWAGRPIAAPPDGDVQRLRRCADTLLGFSSGTGLVRAEADRSPFARTRFDSMLRVFAAEVRRLEVSTTFERNRDRCEVAASGDVRTRRLLEVALVARFWLAETLRSCRVSAGADRLLDRRRSTSELRERDRDGEPGARASFFRVALRNDRVLAADVERLDRSVRDEGATRGG